METLEGRQSVLAALLAQQRKFQVILVQHGAHEEKIREVLEAAEANAVPVKRVGREELDGLAHGSSHGGVVAICSAKPRISVEQLLVILDQAQTAPLLLLIEGIEDSRNLGFVLRTAEAMGVHAVLIKKHLWDFDATEVARPASGAFERLPMVQIDTVEPLQVLQSRGLRLIGCLAGARRDIYHADLTFPTIIAIGGEKRGLSGAVRDICDMYMTIPTAGGASSLSLTHSAAIVLSEANRQRMRTMENG